MDYREGLVMEVKTTALVERNDKEVKLYVVGEAEPWESGQQGHIDNWMPDEGGYAIIEEIFLDEAEDNPWTGALTKEEQTVVKSDLMSALEDVIRDGQEAEAEDRHYDKYEADCDHYDQDYGDYGPDINDF
jgi:hypothetical protein